MHPRSLLSASLVALVACGTSPAMMMRPDTGPGPDTTPVDVGATDAGTSDTSMQEAATPDAGPPRVLKVSGGSFGHSCALLSTGLVRCWGVNDNGQLGVSPAESRQRCRIPQSSPPQTLPCEHTPRDVPGLDNVSDISVGNGGTCAVKRDGSVWCWGVNDAGQLGGGTHDVTPHPTPTRVMMPAARAIAYGSFHVCALLSDGTVQCWGNNNFGQVGLAPAMSDGRCDAGGGDTVACHRVPRAVPGLTGVRQISLGRNHSCALLDDGSARCWGLNQAAQLGTGTVGVINAAQPEPQRVLNLTGATQIAAGGSHSCAVLSTGEVRCWGWNDLGQIGGSGMTMCTASDGRPFRCAMMPTVVPELPGARQIAAGRWHTCAVLGDGRVRCAGRNDDGQLGLGTISTDRCSAPPDLFPCARMFSDVMLPASEEATVGNYHSCARLADGTVRCWGAGYYGQTGDGTTTSRPGPVATSNLP